MNAERWNILYPPGTAVRVVLPTGERLESHTAGMAETWGDRDWIAVLGVHRGYIALDAVEPLAPRDGPDDVLMAANAAHWLPDMHL